MYIYVLIHLAAAVICTDGLHLAPDISISGEFKFAKCPVIVTVCIETCGARPPVTFIPGFRHAPSPSDTPPNTPLPFKLMAGQFLVKDLVRGNPGIKQ